MKRSLGSISEASGYKRRRTDHQSHQSEKIQPIPANQDTNIYSSTSHYPKNHWQTSAHIRPRFPKKSHVQSLYRPRLSVKSPPTSGTSSPLEPINSTWRPPSAASSLLHSGGLSLSKNQLLSATTSHNAPHPSTTDSQNSIARVCPELGTFSFSQDFLRDPAPVSYGQVYPQCPLASSNASHSSGDLAQPPCPTACKFSVQHQGLEGETRCSRHVQAVGPPLSVGHGTASSMQSCVLCSGGDITVTTAGTINQYFGQPSQSLDSCQKVLDWLSPPRDYGIQHDTFEKVAEGTGGWLLRCQAFSHWLSTASGTLWGTGIPGAGKTFLSSIVIDHLKRKIRPSVVAYAYCRYKDELSATQVLASLLRQLGEGSEEGTEHVKTALYDPCTTQKTSLTLSDVKDVIKGRVQLLDRVFIVVDALDELRDDVRQELVTFLDSLNASLFLTSREIRLSMRASHWHYFSIRPPAEDFHAFVTSEVKRYPNLVSLFQGNDEALKRMIEQVEKQSDGMFLLAALQISAVRRATNLLNLQNRLKALPMSLDGIYGLTLKRIISQEDHMKSLALRAILWVTYATRSLHIDELLVALSIEPDTTELGPATCTNESILVSACSGLVTVERENRTVRLVHFTAQDFFAEYRTGIFETPHAFLADACAKYQRIIDHDLKLGVLPNLSGLAESARSKPFCDYACRNMGVHLAKNLVHPFTSEDIPQASLNFLLEREEGSSLIWLEPTETSDRHQWPDEPMYIGTAAHFAAFHGLVPLLEQYPGDASAFSIDGYTPLYYACKNGHTAIAARLLSDFGVGVNDPVYSGFRMTPLSVACTNQQEGVLKLLLANPDIDLDKGRPLFYCWTNDGWQRPHCQMPPRRYRTQDQHTPHPVSLYSSQLSTKFSAFHISM